MTEEVKTEAEKGQEQMDAANLFREEIYTDRKIGVIRCLVPVTAEGKVDESRKVIYTGEAQIMTQMGALPISFDIEAITSQPLSQITAKPPRPASKRP